MSKQITIQLPDSDPKKPAPLLVNYKYQPDSQPQPAYIQLDLTNGKVIVEHNPFIGFLPDNKPFVPDNVHTGEWQQYPIRNDLTVDQIAEVINEIKDDLQYIYEHSEIKEIVTFVIKTEVGFTDEAAQRNNALKNPVGGVHGNSMESLVVKDLADWIVYMSMEEGKSFMPSEHDDIADFIKSYDLDGILTNDSLEEALSGIWLNQFAVMFESPNPYEEASFGSESNIAQYLIDNNYCPDSLLDEMKEQASQRNIKQGIEAESPSM